jgi:hypothetical protein
MEPQQPTTGLDPESKASNNQEEEQVALENFHDVGQDFIEA